MSELDTIPFDLLKAAAEDDTALAALFANHKGRLLLEELPEDWEVHPFRRGVLPNVERAPLVAIHVPTELILPCTVETLIQRVNAVAGRTHALPPVHEHRIVKTLTVFLLEDHRGYASRYFVADATDGRVETLSAEQMWEHATHNGWPATDVLVPAKLPEPAPAAAIVEPGEAVASPRRVPGRPAGQTVSDRPTRQAVEVMGNAKNGRERGAPEVIDIFAALMEDGYEYSDVMEAAESFGEEQVGYHTVAARLVALDKKQTPKAAAPPPYNPADDIPF